MSNELTLEEQATGCKNAGGYRDFAEANGFPFCEVFDWTSSAGDWTFIVSKDGSTWYVMTQTNNWPSIGFTRTIDPSREFYGTAEDVLQEMCEELQ